MDDRARAPAVAVDQVEAADCEARSPSSPSGEARPVARLGGKRGELQQQLHERSEGPAAAASEAGRAEFEEIIAPLEKASGKPLGGPGRELCRAAFDENAHGFRVCAADALRRATSNASGLLVRMVQDGDHRDVQPPSASSSPSFQRAEAGEPQLPSLEERRRIAAEARAAFELATRTVAR